jgi:hypothetical protein
MNDRCRRLYRNSLAFLLLTAFLSGCCTVPKCGPFPQSHDLVDGPDIPLSDTVARIKSYEGHHPNNIPTGDQVAYVYLTKQLPGLGGVHFGRFELNFFVPRETKLTRDYYPPFANQWQGQYHYYYLKESWCRLMTALNGTKPMYARWDITNLVADISSDPTFKTPQPWPSLVIDPTPSPSR